MKANLSRRRHKSVLSLKFAAFGAILSILTYGSPLAHAASTDSALTPAVERHIPKGETKDHSTAPAGDPRGAQNSPMFVNIVPPEKQNGEHPTDWWVAVPTWLLAIFTLGLFAYTAKLFGANARLVDAAEKSAKAAEQAIVNVERPYVFVFGAHKFEMDNRVDDGFTPFIAYNVANYGKLPATIERAVVGIVLPDSNGMPQVPLEVDRIHWLVRNPVLATNDPKELHESVPSGMNHKTYSNDEVGVEDDSGMEIFFRITLYYKGPFSSGHETSACWRLNRGNNRFEPYGHEDYNYTK